MNSMVWQKTMKRPETVTSVLSLFHQLLLFIFRHFCLKDLTMFGGETSPIKEQENCQVFKKELGR